MFWCDSGVYYIYSCQVKFYVVFLVVYVFVCEIDSLHDNKTKRGVELLHSKREISKIGQWSRNEMS